MNIKLNWSFNFLTIIATFLKFILNSLYSIILNYYMFRTAIIF